jgi:hypothetical protein
VSYVGSIEGDIYTHCWFYESARRALKAKNFGDTCGGITVIALTAFMVESYLNLSCKLIFDYKSRVSKVLDNNPDNLIEKIDQTSEEFEFSERVAIAYGFQEQLNKLIDELSSVTFGQKKIKFKAICRTQPFYSIDDDIRFSPKAKFKALSETFYTDEQLKSTHQQLIDRLFSLRNQLAHGRSEFVKESVRVDSESLTKFSPEMIPILQADWQRECSLAKAHELFNSACELINILSKQAFNITTPFHMPTHMAALTKG